MSLIAFHRVLIASAILFCLGYAGWELVAWARGGGAASLWLGLVFVALAAGLSFYLARLRRFLDLPD